MKGLRSILKKSAVSAGLSLAMVAVAPSQEPPATLTGSEARALVDSVRGLQVQVQQLSAMLRAVEADEARSRAESRELREQLTQTRAQLATLQSSFEAARRAPAASAAATVASTSSPSPAAPQLVTAKEIGRLGERLSQVEENQQLHGAQIADEYQTKIESGSKYRVRLSGVALLNLFANRGSTDNLDVPTLALPPRPLDSSGNIGATVRQSSLGLEVFGPEFVGARTRGDVQFDFFGGFPPNENGVTEGLVRMRVATVHFDWPDTSIVAGQDAPFFSPNSPTSLATLAYPALAYSGNLWGWIPQVRIERRISVSESSSLLVQGGVLDPLTGEPSYSPFYRTAGAGERSGQPAYATRIAWSSTASGRPVTLGAGAYYSRQDWGFGRAVDAWAGTADWRVPLGRYVQWSGELYQGRGIGGFGAAAGRSVLWNGRLTDPATRVVGLNTAGGWSQLKLSANERLEFNAAFGEDVPRDYDLQEFPGGGSYLNSPIGRSQSGFFNTIYHARSNLLLSLEYRRLWTAQVNAPRNTADQVNGAIGVLF